MKYPIHLLRGNSHAGESLVFGTLGVSLFVYSLYSHYQEEVAWKLSPYLFPIFIAVFLVLVAVAMLIQGAQKGEKQGFSGAGTDRLLEKSLRVHVPCCDLLFSAAGTRVSRDRHPDADAVFPLSGGTSLVGKALLYSGILTFLIYAVFQLLLNVRLPQGGLVMDFTHILHYMAEPRFILFVLMGSLSGTVCRIDTGTVSHDGDRHSGLHHLHMGDQ